MQSLLMRAPGSPFASSRRDRKALVESSQPRVELAQNLLCSNFEDTLAVREAFGVSSPLRRHGLLQLLDDPSQPEPPLLGRHFKVDERIVAFLMGSNAPAPASARLVSPSHDLGKLCLPAALKNQLMQLIERGAPDVDDVLYLQGPYGVGKRSIAEALCRRTRRDLVIYELASPATSSEDHLRAQVGQVIREAAIRDAAAFFRGVGPYLSDPEGPRSSLLWTLLQACHAPVFLAGEDGGELSGRLGCKRFVRLEIPRPGAQDRAQLWRRFLPDGNAQDIEQVAGRFRLTGGQIRDAVATARGLASLRDRSASETGSADLHEACRRQSNRRLATLAQHIIPRYRWQDIVLSSSRREQLREALNAARFRPLVLGDWGFDRKLSLGKGLNILFSGP